MVDAVRQCTFSPSTQCDQIAAFLQHNSPNLCTEESANLVTLHLSIHPRGLIFLLYRPVFVIGTLLVTTFHSTQTGDFSLQKFDISCSEKTQSGHIHSP